MTRGMLAGCCRNVIIASVKQSEVKKQERTLYLADYPHASSRLQGKRADSLNRQEQAEHRPYLPETHGDISRLSQHSQTRYHTLSLSHTHKHLNRVIEELEISKLISLKILSKQTHFWDDANANFGKNKNKHKLCVSLCRHCKQTERCKMQRRDALTLP